jgi:phosphoribosyl 1,2-cyclic phosphate phosphodiesterase
LRRIFAFAFTGEYAVPGYVYPIEHLVTGPFEIGKTRIVPVLLPHGRFGVTGFIFERDGEKLAAYFSDCNAVPPVAMEAARGVKHLIIDGLRHRPHPTHCSITDALEAGAAMKADHIWLTHICHEVFHAPDEAALPLANAKLAYDGLRIEA